MNARTSPPPTDPWDPGVRAGDVPIVEGVEPGPFDDLAKEFETASDVDTRTVKITFFPDETARSLHTADLTLPQLADRIAKQTAASKMELPWLKLAIFGDKRSEKNCLRTNANVLHVTGIEVEHDAGEISFDTAIAVMRKARIRSLLYTSPSYVPAARERWRILVPLSKNHPPEAREKMIARINGLFGGKIAPESFTLSQAYLFGHTDNAAHLVEVVDGDFLDVRDDTYAGSIFKDGSRVRNGAGNTSSNGDHQQQRKSRADDDPEPIDRDKIEAALDVVSSNCHYDVWLSVAGALHHTLGASGFELFDRWSAKATGEADDGTPRYTADKSKERWRGARTLTQYTARTIFWLADQADPGWRARYEWDRSSSGRAGQAHAGAGAGQEQASAGAGGGAGAGAQQSAGIQLEYYENFGNAVAKKAIIKGVLYKGERSSWVGPPGSGKSALLASVAIDAANGTDWRGYRSKGRVGVVYFALERGQLVKRRLMAHAGPPDLPIAVASKAINLLSPACVATIVETIRTAEAHYGCPVGLIIIDTFNKGVAIGGGDESSAKDQNITAANLKQVQELTDVHIALIGHTGKDESRGARGSNAHLGDVDMMVQISVAEGIRTANITKINDGAEGLLTRFRVEPITLGQDEDGDDITTAIVTEDEPDEEGRAKLSKQQRRAMEMLERTLLDGGPVPIPPGKSGEYPVGIKPVPIERWRSYCIKGGLSTGSAESAERAFRRAMTDLQSMRRIGVWDGLVWIAYD